MIEIPKEPNLNDLASLKEYRYNQIDAKTSELIQQGFTYDSKQFSLSLKGTNEAVQASKEGEEKE